MSESLIAISVGNSRVKVCAFVSGRIEASSAVSLADDASISRAIVLADNALRSFPRAPFVVASVVPGATSRMIALCEAVTLDREVLEVGDELVAPIGLHVDPGYTPGVDRLLNAAAAFDILKSACVVVDAGTAITVDYVDGVGTFHGGAILPGAHLMRKALHEGTAQLPLVELAAPQEALGHNTTEAIRSGIFNGLRGAVRELVEEYAKATGIFPLVVVTGGDAPMLFGDWDLADRHVPELTLMGLRAAYHVAAREPDRDDEDARA